MTPSPSASTALTVLARPAKDRPTTVVMAVPQPGTTDYEDGKSHSRDQRPLRYIRLPAPTQHETADWEQMEFMLPASIWLNTLHKALAQHVRVPRSAKSGTAGSQHPKFVVQNSPLELVKRKCLQAGMVQIGEPSINPRTRVQITTFKGLGPMTAYRFCQTNLFKKYGQGSGALMAPGKGRDSSAVLTVAIPPITVTVR